MRTILALAAFPVLASLLGGCTSTRYLAASAHEKLQCLSEPDDAPLPSRRQAAFPFRLIYYIDGRRVVVEDTQVCDFKGRSCGAYGREDLWQPKLASGRSQILIRQLDKNHNYVASIGECPTLMADPQYRRVDGAPWNHVELQAFRHGHLKETIVGSQDLQAEHGIEVISFEQWADGSGDGP